ncbi:MAG: hypothetical protein AAF585_21840, partial [Verrucomicrobiota bacterium]
ESVLLYFIATAGSSAHEPTESEIRANRIAEARKLADPKDANAADLRTAMAWLEPLNRHDKEVVALLDEWRDRYIYQLSNLLAMKWVEGSYSEAIELAGELCRPSLEPDSDLARDLFDKYMPPSLMLRPHQLRRAEWVRAVIGMNYEDDAAYLYRLHGGYGDIDGDRRYGELRRESVAESTNPKMFGLSEERVFRVSPSFAQDIANHSRTIYDPSADPFADLDSSTPSGVKVTHVSLRNKLSNLGINVSDDDFLRFDSRFNLVHLRAKLVEFSRADLDSAFQEGAYEIAGLSVDPAEKAWSPENYGLDKRPTWTPGGPDDEAKTRIIDKLESIRLTRFDFDSLTVEQAAQQLQLASAEADTEESDPNQKGVAIIVGTEPGTGQLSGEQLGQVSLRDALRAVLAAAQLKMKIEPQAVVFVSMDEEDELYVQHFNVPPGFLSVELSPEVEAELTRKHPGRTRYVELGPRHSYRGEFTFYSTETHQLLVKSTLAELAYTADWTEAIRDETGNWYRSPILGPWRVQPPKRNPKSD